VIAENFAAKNQWSEMALASTPLKELLKSVQNPQQIQTQIEDDTYLQNALNDLKLAKSFDRLD
jgi:hypothetical protein